MAEEEDNIEPAIGYADGSVMKHLRWIPVSEQISATEPIRHGYCIFYWDLNGDPDMVEIDSLWTKDSDAVNRMKYLIALECKIAEEGSHPKINIEDSHLSYFHSPEEYVIRWFKNDGTMDSTRGIFCKKVPCNDRALLNMEHLKVLDEDEEIQ